MSKNDQWMPLYIGDYVADTMHLSGPEHGAYLLLLMHYWRNGPLLDDDKVLAGIARTERKAWDREVGPAVRAFFVAEAGRLHQKRMDAEREKAGAISTKRKAAADARWAAKPPGESSKSNANASANAMPKDTHAGARPSASPLQLQQEEEPSLRSGQAGPASPPPDARTSLFREGLGRLRRLTGKPEGSSRALLGRLLRDARDDAAGLSLVLAQAEAERPADPVPWIVATIAARTEPRALIRSGKPSNLDWMLDDMPGRHHA